MPRRANLAPHEDRALLSFYRTWLRVFALPALLFRLAEATQPGTIEIVVPLPCEPGTMRYVIDGYNLLHALGLLTGRVGPHGLHKARLALLSRLSGHPAIDATFLTVVFDARHPPPGARSEEEYQGIHIYYAVGQEADDVIEEIIRTEPAPRQLTVISDDHRLQQAARRRQCLVLGCLDYFDQLEQRRPRVQRSADEESAAKPQGVSGEEVRRWMAEFADLADDRKVRDELNPGYFGEESG